MHNLDFKLASSTAIENALSQQLEEARLRRNMTQQQLAREAGVSRSTITRLAQANKGISFDSFIRIMKALQLTDRLGLLLPDESLSPLQALEQRPDRQRKRARPKKTSGDSWTWNDDPNAS